MYVLLLLLSLVLTGCMREEPELTALPEEPVLLEPFVGETVVAASGLEDQAEVVECPHAVDAPYRRRSKRPRPVATPPPQEAPALTLVSLPPTQTAPPKTQKPISVEQMIAQANRAALVKPTQQGYFGNRAVYRYVYEPGRVYPIHTNSQQFTKLYFPPGEKPATVPTLNEELWKVVEAKIGPQGRVQSVLGVRPVDEGQRADMAIEMESGRAYFLRFEPSKHPMLGVTWELPGAELGEPVEGSTTSSTAGAPACGGPTANMHMPVELASLHTGYKIETKGTPGFVPTQIFDDGRRTLVRLKALVGNAPIVQTFKPDGSKFLVQFAPYYIPNDPARGLYYVIESIWGKFELTGTDGASVIITRLNENIAVAQPWTRH